MVNSRFTECDAAETEPEALQTPSSAGRMPSVPASSPASSAVPGPGEEGLLPGTTQRPPEPLGMLAVLLHGSACGPDAGENHSSAGNAHMHA